MHGNMAHHINLKKNYLKRNRALLFNLFEAIERPNSSQQNSFPAAICQQKSCPLRHQRLMHALAAKIHQLCYQLKYRPPTYLTLT